MSASSTDRSAVRSEESDVSRLQHFFRENPEVLFVRFQMVDLSSMVRVTVLPKTAALDAADQGFIPAPASPFVALASLTALMLEHAATDMDLLRPDWNSLKVCTYYPTHAVVMCRCQQQQVQKPRNGYMIDPRSILMRQVQSASDEQIDFLVGLEIEFLVSTTDTDFAKPPPKTIPLATLGLRNQFTPVIDNIVLAIEEAGFKVNKYHPEDTTLGLYEVVLAPLTPLEAADAFIYCHETIKTICQQKGFQATLAPHPFEQGVNIGSHVNLSISRPHEGNSERFLAGLLGHLRAISAFAMSSYDSAARVERVKEWVQWADKCKVAVVNQRRKGLWEVRCPDATMNPYLTLAAFIAAGMHGIRTQQELKIKGRQDRKPLTDESRKELNITEKLPSSLEEALTALGADEVLCDDENGLGAELVKYYQGVKRKDIPGQSGMSDLERRLFNIFLF